MLQTTLAHVAAYLADYFFKDYEDARKRVVYGDNESYYEKIKERKLLMPGIVFTMTQLSIPHGPSKPTKFINDDNAGGTKTYVYDARRAMITCSMAYYCSDMMESFNFMQDYLVFQNHAVIPVVYHADDLNSIELDCALCSFEDLSVPPAGTKSKPQDSTGLIYELEGGFTIPTLFLQTSQNKIIRCIRYEEKLVSLNDFDNAFLILRDKDKDYSQGIKDITISDDEIPQSILDEKKQSILNGDLVKIDDGLVYSEITDTDNYREKLRNENEVNKNGR